jgi:hypothetical protein
MNDHGSLVAAMKQHGEVVISAVGHGRPEELDGQLKIVEAIKEAGCVKVRTYRHFVLKIWLLHVTGSTCKFCA